MRAALAAALLGMAALTGAAREQLREVVVMARRPLRDIGVEKTPFDSATLRESVALSMADVLAFNSGVFVKNYGRATQSTIAFRGTSAAHTRVSWNGMDISSPMLGSTDFSTIPSAFIDRATLLHGSSSLAESSGGLGGAVVLGSEAERRPGWHASYTQGIGSFSTFDEYLTVGYGGGRWRSSTRVAYSSSPNDFPYRNHDKKENIYDDDHNIVATYYPRERNRSGAYHDFHAMQDVGYDAGRAGRLALSAWYMSSDRELPLLTTDYADGTASENKRREQTLRAVASWTRTGEHHRIDARAGYSHTWTAYDYRRDPGSGVLATLSRSRSSVDTYMGRGLYEWLPSDRLSVSAEAQVSHAAVRSVDGQALDPITGGLIPVGYRHGRTDCSLTASAKWRPSRRLGMSLILREDAYGDRITSPVPALLLDLVPLPRANLLVRASVSRNHRAPTLNDLYYMPGGNPDLRDETGWTYDAGLSGRWSVGRRVSIDASANWFDSRIDDWILWLPTVKGFYTPRNIRRVHAYGIESRAGAAVDLGRGWTLDLQGSLSWTPSINEADPVSPADISPGKQLPYVPRVSASAVGRLSWRRWTFTYKWCHYSERYTQSSGDESLSGILPPYYMSNVMLERSIPLRRVSLDLKLAVNNLLDEEYLSVLARPMPGINFEFFIGISI
ncbi:MAG: TonB-dependent receptor [Bacteroides sp.]|nr:TonB-dependent receptor [Bacteroides sp.]